MEYVKNCNVLLSCPSDIDEDYIRTVEYVLSETNKISKEYKKIEFVLKYWKNDVPPSYGTPQELINLAIVKNSDIVVALFKTKLGSPTRRFESGSVEEIYIMAEKGKTVAVCFYDGLVNLNHVDPAELLKLREFQKKYGNEGLYLTFTSCDDLRAKLLNTFRLYLHNFKTESLPRKNNKEHSQRVITRAEKIGSVNVTINN